MKSFSFSAQISSSLYPAQFLRRTGLARWVSCPDELFKEPRIESESLNHYIVIFITIFHQHLLKLSNR